MGLCGLSTARGVRCWAVELAVATATVVITTASAAAAQGACSVPAASSWTPVEKTVWQQLCVGEGAGLTAEGDPLDPNQPEGWDDARVVSSAFVEQLLTEPYAPLIDRHGIRLAGAWFPHGLDIEEAALNFPLRCQHCRIAGLRAANAVIEGTLDLRDSTIEGDLRLFGADIRSDLILDRSVVSGALTADQLTVAGSMFLRDGSRFSDITLRNADIGGDFHVSGGSVVSGTLNADELTVTGGVFFSDGSRFTDIDLLGADIGGALEADRGSVVSGALNTDDATVASSVFLRDRSKFNNISLNSAHIGGQLNVSGGSVVSGTLNADELTVAAIVSLNDGSQFNDINLRGADIGGQFTVNRGSVVSGILNADQITVATDVLLREGSQFNNIDLLGADIGGNLEVDCGSVVSGTLDAELATVGGSLFLRDKSRFHDIHLLGADIGGLIYLNNATWASDGSLDLRQAHAGGVSTDKRKESWPPKLQLNGFVFQQWANPNPQHLGSGWFTAIWLGRDDAFSPGPYTQLAEVMDAAGHPTIAADLRYTRSHKERLAVPWFLPNRWGRELHGLVLGYGYRPWWAVGWFCAAWLIGWLVFLLRVQPTPGRFRIRLVKRGGWSPKGAAKYSLHRLLPAVNLINPDEFPEPIGAQKICSDILMPLGLLLTLFIVGWLGNLVVQP